MKKYLKSLKRFNPFTRYCSLTKAVNAFPIHRSFNFSHTFLYFDTMYCSNFQLKNGKPIRISGARRGSGVGAKDASKLWIDAFNAANIFLATAALTNQQPSHPAAKQQLQSATTTQRIVRITVNLKPFRVSSLPAHISHTDPVSAAQTH